MKYLARIIMLTPFILPVPCFPQISNTSSSRIYLCGTPIQPEDLDRLIDAATIIVEGRYGRIEPGGSTTVDVPTATVDVPAALPVSRHEIMVDNVLKGENAAADNLTLKLPRAPDALDIYPWLKQQQEGVHLFFFTLNDDGTVAPVPSMFDLREEAGSYVCFQQDRTFPAFPDLGKQQIIDRITARSR